jgi:hypothetical protein
MNKRREVPPRENGSCQSSDHILEFNFFIWAAVDFDFDDFALLVKSWPLLVLSEDGIACGE